MKFDELDEKMRIFETANDLVVLPGIYMVARLDGRIFTRLTKEVHQFEAPFDARFRDLRVTLRRWFASFRPGEIAGLRPDGDRFEAGRGRRNVEHPLRHLYQRR